MPVSGHIGLIVLRPAVLRLRQNGLRRCYALTSICGCKIQAADVAGPVFNAALCLTGGLHPVVVGQRAVAGIPCFGDCRACVIIIGFRIADLCSHLLVMTGFRGFGRSKVRSVKAELYVSTICGDLRCQIVTADGKGHVKGIRIRGILAVCFCGAKDVHTNLEILIIL